MYQLSKDFQTKVVDDCFDEVCKTAQKEEAGALKGLVNTVVKAKIYFDQERNVLVVNKKQHLSINYIYKFSDSKKRIRVTQKLDEPYIFEVELNGEIITKECDQYSCECFD